MEEDDIYIYTITSTKRGAPSLYQWGLLQRSRVHHRYTTLRYTAVIGCARREARRSRLNRPLAVGVGREEGVLRYCSDVRAAHHWQILLCEFWTLRRKIKHGTRKALTCQSTARG